VDGHVLAPGDLPDDAGVARRQVRRDVAPDGGDGQKVQPVPRGEGQQQGYGVVDAGIAIDDEGGGHAPVSTA
jgi:hypothetical protein